MAETNRNDANQPHQLFVRADEIDAGTSILSPSTQVPLSALNPTDSSGQIGTARPKPPTRPGLRREGSAVPPPPPSQPPPAPPNPVDVTDSLSLPQLRQLVSQFPKTEQRAYAFQYKEAEDFDKEVDEWFQYTEPEQEREYLLASREAFEQKWKVYCQHSLHTDDASWMEVDQDARRKFMQGIIPDLEGSDMSERIEALGSIYYVLAGTWSITSGLDSSQCSEPFKSIMSPSADQYNTVQLEWMHRGADLVLQSSMIASLYGCLFTAAKPSFTANGPDEEVADLTEQTFDDNEYRELSLCFSCFYLLIESARARVGRPDGERIRQQLSALSPSFLLFLTSTISRLRWDESYNIPLIHAIQLLWKSILLIFGDIQHNLEDVKSILQPRVDPFSAEASHPVLTASPLDYHLFRQEITSKYPAYNPPLPLIPFEVEQKSIIPLMPQHSSRASTQPNGAATTNASSIFHQPVHIATPAPSPPPSPAGPGGKTGKKQNYQTNQNFPFLYPPLDSSSNDLGGKGSTELHDMMVGKKWEGSDVPTSVIEAGELFASRMRMTRAMKQLWKQRDLFMKYDRGWKGDGKSKSQREVEDKDQHKNEDEEDDLEDLTNASLRTRMHAVEHFFHHALPDMQSLVIVLMKIMLSNVQDIAIRNGNFSESQPTSGLNRTKSNSNVTAQTLPMPPPPPQPSEMSIEDLDNIRSREISQKAISATLFLLLKWFKISHILKFEYLTQLLLDSNYVQLTLKYFAHQNLEDLVAFKYDRDDLSFFHYCHLHSDHPPLSPTSPNSHSSNSSADDAMPPPIPRHRRSSGTTSDNPQSTDNSQQETLHPTVDELGNPTSPTSFPNAPIQTFSFRQFHTSIHLLRTLQKLTRHKSHRILLLVQFKSSQILRRILRVPDNTLRLYVLKLFKSQVPYCGRKWRQSNMRVITAIYLHCRPELRDEWLAGMHESSVEGEVEESVPVEWAGRGLTFWWLKRRYPEEMKLRDQKAAGAKATSSSDQLGEGEEWTAGAGQEIEDDERDFFQRELDQLGWGMATLGTGEDVAFGEEAPGVANGVNGGGGGDMGGGHWEQANAATLEAWQNSQER